MMIGTIKKTTIYTVGHSTHEFDQFVTLLMQHNIDAVADVRSVPYSQRQTQFNREKLADALKLHLIKYVFLGKELGARSDNLDYYESGRVSYRQLATTDLFKLGINRVIEGSRLMNVALMCSEKDPLDCHRTILIARRLVNLGSEVAHILADGTLELHNLTLKRLFQRNRMPERELFLTTAELQDQAYALQEQRIAYKKPDSKIQKVQQ